MAKITDLPPAGPLSGAELVPLVQDGETRKGSLAPLVGAALTPFIDSAATQAANALASANAAAFATLQRAFVTIDGRNAYASVSPAAAWNGTAGTGFASTPTDPARTTAKPACRLLVPPRQAFTNHLVVGVAAAANNSGRLDNLGLTSVEFLYEGRTVTVTEPSWYSYLDANGQQRSCFGWWAVLLHNGTNSANADTGGADLYIRANPADATMQSRVIGPFRFWPRAALYDTEITIAPSLSEVAGSRYQSLVNAGNFLRLNNRHFARLTLAESGTYDFAALGNVWTTRGYTVIETAPGISATIAKASYTTDTAAQLRSRLDPIWFRGSGITINFRFINEIYRETTITQANTQHVLEGVRLTNSTGRNTLWRKRGYPAGFRVRGNPFFMECAIDNVGDPCVGASLVRNCSISTIIRDAVTDAFCVVGTRTDDLDSSWWNAEVNAMTVTYTGAASTATLELSGANDAASRTFTARENGSVVGTFTVGNTEALFTAGTNYNVANVVAWINGLGGGWSATLQDDTRAACTLARPGTSGAAFAAVSVKNVTLQLVTILDVHSDWYQQNATAVLENVICVNNIGTRLVAQDIFITGANGAADFLFLNNAFHQKTEGEFSPGFDNYLVINSQLQRTHSHVVIAHCTWANQGLSLRTDGNAYNPDAYCLVANNVARVMTWAGTPDSDLRITNNHLETGATNPANGVNTTIGGTVATMFVNAAAGAFQPAGELLTNQKPAILRLPARGPVRQALAPAGALA